MDRIRIASVVAPIMVKGTEVPAKTIGGKLSGLISDLCQLVANKFKGDSYAEQTLVRARQKPESRDRQSALMLLLAEKMEEDPDFAQKIQQLVDAVQKENSRSVFDQRGQTVHGSQTNIGEANAPVFSGVFSGP